MQEIKDSPIQVTTKKVKVRNEAIQWYVPVKFPLRDQCTPNDHHSSALLYGRTVDANPTKVHIF